MVSPGSAIAQPLADPFWVVGSTWCPLGPSVRHGLPGRLRHVRSTPDGHINLTSSTRGASFSAAVATGCSPSPDREPAALRARDLFRPTGGEHHLERDAIQRPGPKVVPTSTIQPFSMSIRIRSIRCERTSGSLISSRSESGPTTPVPPSVCTSPAAPGRVWSCWGRDGLAGHEGCSSFSTEQKNAPGRRSEVSPPIRSIRVKRWSPGILLRCLFGVGWLGMIQGECPSRIAPPLRAPRSHASRSR